MSETSKEFWSDFSLEDVTDWVEVGSFVSLNGLKPAFLRVAIERLIQLIPQLPDAEVVKRAMLWHNPAARARGIMATHSADDRVQPISIKDFNWERAAYLLIASRSWIDEYNAISQGALQIFQKHGVAQAIEFVDSLWIDAWVIRSYCLSWVRWLLVRAELLNLDIDSYVQQSEMLLASFLQARTQNYLAKDDLEKAGRAPEKIALQRAAELTGSSRHSSIFLEKAELIKMEAESELVQARLDSSTQAEWIRRVRLLWPRYVCAYQLFGEVMNLCSRDQEDSIEVERRFVDERQADIRGVIWGRQHLVTMKQLHESLDEHGVRYAIKTARFYQLSRVSVPDCIWKMIISGLSEEKSKEDNGFVIFKAVEPYYDSLSLGQRHATAPHGRHMSREQSSMHWSNCSNSWAGLQMLVRPA
jgi:hypothetical protein